MRAHVFAWRRQIRGFRQHGDFWMLRFLTWRVNRAYELKHVLRLGLPKVEKK